MADTNSEFKIQNYGGIVACGHPLTAEAARIILDAGGNAFDAIVAAAWAACVVEPVLASPGGGGFLLAQREGASGAMLFDFFTQTPRRRCPAGEVDFFPIVADFGGATQEFHIGLGSMSTPGMVRGLFRVQRELGSLPMTTLMEPAVTWAREGVAVNAFQAYIFRIIQAIYLHSPASRAIYGSATRPDALVGEGEHLRQPDLADALETLAIEGDDLFYRGEMAERIVAACEQGGGCLQALDLEDYRVELRRPLELDYRGARLWLNPPPSSGGILIAVSLKLLEAQPLDSGSWGRPETLVTLGRVMALTNQAREQRYDGHAWQEDIARRVLAEETLTTYRQALEHGVNRLGSTTQISVIDGRGNVASLTASNGEGAGYIIPGTGIMMNNMLGEEDVNPHGFHRWRENTRISSMMSPTIVRKGGRVIATGSGGSNRIRTAILQVLVKLLDLGMDIEEAVNSPRIHYENGLLSVEGGFAPELVRALERAYPRIEVWEDRNLFFGGAHTVLHDEQGNRYAGAGDLRRGGVAA